MLSDIIFPFFHGDFSINGIHCMYLNFNSVKPYVMGLLDVHYHYCYHDYH